MKLIIKILFVLFLVATPSGCGPGKSAQTQLSPEMAQAPENPESALPSKIPIPASIARIMNYLASDQLMGRDSGSMEIEQAALFIEDQFRINQLAPYFSSFRDTLTNDTTVAYNIVGVIQGNDPELKKEYILIGAHYDHIGVVASQSMDSIANGANDNASGTAIVMELARHFGKEKTNGRGLIFALFSAEEKGLLGSRHLAKKLKEQELPLYVMLNFEMMGVPLLDKDYHMYLTGYELSNMAEVCNKYANENVVGYLPTAKEYSLFQRSDNFPFHLEFQVPSQTFCSFDFTNFDHYHKVGDETSLIDFEHMASLVDKLIPIVEGISNSREKEITYH